MTTLRERFELFFTKQWGDDNSFAKLKDGQYAFRSVQLAWIAYQAGHAEGVKETARRCADIRNESGVERIKTEYQETLK